MRMVRHVLLVVALLLILQPVHARHFKVYGYGTLDPGEIELVYWTDYVWKSDNEMNYFGATNVDREGLWGHTLEVEYGITERFMIAAYVDFEKPSDEDIKYIQSRIVTARYRFGDPGERFFDTAIYVEYYLPDPDYLGMGKEAIEGRLILEKDIGDKTLRLNPRLEKVVSGPDVEEGLEFEYGARLYGPLTTNFKWGLELYGSLGELVDFKPVDKQKHYIVPALTYKISHSLKWNLGAALGLTDASDDVVIKRLLEWEL